MSVPNLETIQTQLNEALLQKDILSNQLEQVCDKVKALRNVLAGVELGRKMVFNEMMGDKKSEGSK